MEQLEKQVANTMDKSTIIVSLYASRYPDSNSFDHLEFGNLTGIKCPQFEYPKTSFSIQNHSLNKSKTQ